jgi:predicted RNA-binding protein
MSIYLCIVLLILFSSTTLVQGHDISDMNTDVFYIEGCEELVKLLDECDNKLEKNNDEIKRMIIKEYKIEHERNINIIEKLYSLSWNKFIIKIYNIDNDKFDCCIINYKIYQNCTIYYNKYSVYFDNNLNLYGLCENNDVYYLDVKLYELLKNKKWKGEINI